MLYWCARRSNSADVKVVWMLAVVRLPLCALAQALDHPKCHEHEMWIQTLLIVYVSLVDGLVVLLSVNEESVDMLRS